jgi:thioredoxin reductase
MGKNVVIIGAGAAGASAAAEAKRQDPSLVIAMM